MSLTPVWYTMFLLFGFQGLVIFGASLWFFYAFRVHCREIRALQAANPKGILRRVEAVELAWEDAQQKLQNSFARLRQEAYRKRVRDEAEEEQESASEATNRPEPVVSQRPLSRVDLYRAMREKMGNPAFPPSTGA